MSLFYRVPYGSAGQTQVVDERAILLRDYSNPPV